MRKAPIIKNSETGNTVDLQLNQRLLYPESEKYIENEQEKSVILYVNQISEKQKELEEKLNNYERKIEELAEKNQENINKQNSRNIEIIGIFSGIMALVITDVKIIDSATNFLVGILLIVGLTASLAIFVLLIHNLFSGKESKRQIEKGLAVPSTILIILVIVGILFYGFQIDLNKIVNAQKRQTSKNITMESVIKSTSEQ